MIATDLGRGGCPPPTLAAELARLGSPPLELGGVSQDLTAPAGAAQPAPTSWQTATLYPLPAGFWSELHCLLSSTHEPLTVGLNMRTGNLAWATQMAAEARAAAVDGLSFSLGNEPDLYELPNYSALDKPLAGEEAAAAGLYEQLARATCNRRSATNRWWGRNWRSPRAGATQLPLRRQSARPRHRRRAPVSAEHLPLARAK